MKKFKLFIIIIANLFIISGVSAARLDIKDGTTNDSYVSLSLSGDDLSNYKSVTFNIPSGFVFNSTSQNVTVEDNLVKVSNPVYGQIGTIEVNKGATSDYSINISNIKFYNQDDTPLEKNDISSSIKVVKAKSSDASLSNLIISQGELSPAFSPNNYDYTVNVPDTIDQLKITANGANNASVSGGGAKILNNGENKFDIVVTSEDGKNNKTYHITVIKGKINEPSAYLKSLTINTIGCFLSPSFDAKNTKYSVDVTEDITDLDFKYETMDENALVTIEGNSNFVDGENLVTITVEASDKSEKMVYEITVNKNMESEESSNKLVISKKKKSNVGTILFIVFLVLVVISVIITVLIKKGIIKLPKKGKKNNIKNTDTKEKEESVSTSPIKLNETKEDTYNFNDDNDESITAILRGELYDENAKTQTFDTQKFKDNKDDEESLDKTKEFDLK